MKKNVYLLLVSVFLVGCNNTNDKTFDTTTNSSTKTSSTTTVSSSFVELTPTEVRTAEYNLADNTFTVSGTTDIQNKISVKDDKNNSKDINVSSLGKWEYTDNIPENQIQLVFSDGKNTFTRVVKSLSDLQNTSTSSTSDSQVEETVPSSSKDSESKPSTEVSKDQKELLVVFTQQDLDDYGYDYKFKSYDDWNVVTQDSTNSKRFIITTEDRKIGRIKSIYEWDGNKDSGATLIYLLVGGTEHLNNLNQ